MAWLDSLDESSISVDEWLGATKDMFALTPVLDSGLPSNFSSFAHSEHNILSWDASNHNRRHASISCSELSQDSDACIDWLHPCLSMQSTAGGYQPASTIDGPGFLRPDQVDDKAEYRPQVSSVTNVPHQTATSYNPNKCSGTSKTQSASTPDDTTECSPIGDRGPVRRRKRKPAHVRLDDAIVCTDGDTSASGQDRKAQLRGCHNQVERNYRSRLNNDFQLLFNAISECTDEKDLVSMGFTDGGARGRSKGSILRLARRRLLALQTENRLIAGELNAIRHHQMKCQMGHAIKPLGESEPDTRNEIIVPHGPDCSMIMLSI